VSLSIKAATHSERTTVIELHGEFDYATAQQFRERVSKLLRRGSAKVIVVDLAKVSFLDSTAVGTLVVASRICADCRVRLLLRGVNPFIARLFAVLGVSEVLGVPAPAGNIVPRRAPAQRGGEPLAQPA
jgi:anti-sigma B factor antagonist